MSHGGSHSSGGSSGGPSGLKIPKRFILIFGLVFLTFCLVRGIAPAIGASEKKTLLWSLGLSLLSGAITFWVTKTGGHDNPGGSHDAHGHGKHWTIVFLEGAFKFTVKLAIGTILLGWAYSSHQTHLGPEADEIRNARRESEEQLRRIAKGLDGLFSQVTNRVTAPVVDLNKVPKTECPRKPEFFSKSIPLPTGVNFGWQTIGSTGTLVVWDGQGKIWLCKPGEGHDFQATELAFASVSGQPIEVEVVYQHKPRRY